MKLITLEMVRDDWHSCYSNYRLAKLYDTPKTAIDVLTLKDGAWAEVPPEDRLWAVLRESLIGAKTLRLFACWCAEKAIAMVKDPDSRSVEAIEVAKKYANGEATDDDLAAARDAAWAAAGDAARAAAMDAQIKTLIQMIEREQQTSCGSPVGRRAARRDAQQGCET